MPARDTLFCIQKLVTFLALKLSMLKVSYSVYHTRQLSVYKAREPPYASC